MFLSLTSNQHKTLKSNKGFTLIELVMVLILIGTVTAIAMPKFIDMKHEAVKANLLSSLGAMKEGINTYDLNSRIQGNTQYPATLPDAMQWGEVPEHPEGISGVSNVQTATNALVDPNWRMLTASVAGAYWYNTQNGIVRARVSDQGTEALTVDFYNEVNGTNISSMGNYGGGGGS